MTMGQSMAALLRVVATPAVAAGTKNVHFALANMPSEADD
jgi:hypothetical protein